MFVETVSGHNHTTRMSCEFAKCHAELSSDPKSWLYLSIWGILPPSYMCSKQQSKESSHEPIRRMECHKGFEVLNIAQWCFELLLLSRNQKKPLESWAFHLRAMFTTESTRTACCNVFLGGSCFFFGVGCDEGFSNNMLVSSYVLLLFSAPMFF